MGEYKTYNVAIADDHKLVRTGLSLLINSFENFRILFQADDGYGVMEHFQKNILPDVLLLDVNMPNMDGYDTAAWVQKNYPSVKVLAISVFSDKFSVIRMLKCGANGHISKSAEPVELRTAIMKVLNNSVYLNDELYCSIIDEMKGNGTGVEQASTLNTREVQFLELLATGKSYKEIARQMYLSPRTLDDYKKALSQKTGIKTRTGLIVYAIKTGMVDVRKLTGS